MQIIPIKYASSTLPESAVFYNGNPNTLHDIVFILYLIKTGNKLILVDAGCETMPGFEMKNFIGTIKALKAIKITPDDIDDVIITHSHHDHIECVKYFKNSIIHIQKDEFEASGNYIPKDFNVNIFQDEYEVGNNVKIVKIGGHSKGSCIVEIADGDKKYVIAGDECYSRECLDTKTPTGSYYNFENSKSFIEKYSNNKYTVLLCHDN